jgi:ABC-type multidrug transport system fused ATPase/permease subunit
VPAVSILLQDYSAWWDAPVLRNLNFNLERLKQADKGILISIVGRLGSAKSAFLLALLGEPLHSTGLCTVRGSIAYVEQSPYIFSGTIQENILFGRVYDAERY